MKAFEARKISEEYNARLNMQEVYSKIEKAARDGSFSLELKVGDLKSPQADELRRQGYNVHLGGDDKAPWVIKW
jgi:hypothetical protein